MLDPTVAAQREREALSAEPMIEQSGRLATGVLLLVGRFGEREGPFEVSLRRGADELLESYHFSYRLPSRPGEKGAPRTLLMVFFPSGGEPLKRGDALVISAPGMSLELEWLDLKSSLTDLKLLARQELAPLDCHTRALVMSFLAKALAIQPKGGAIQLSETLFGLRAGLREHLPLYIHAPDEPRGLAVESIMAVDDRSFYMEGWVRDEEAEIVRLTAVSPEGDRAELAEKLFLFRREDVTNYFSGGIPSRQDPSEKVGFISYFELESPSFLSTGWVLEMENAEGAILEVAGPVVMHDAAAARNKILAVPSRERVPDDDLLEHHVMPALSRIQEHVEAAIKVTSVTDYGSPPESPDISIIVPLYKRVDLIEQQLAEFVLDPEISEAELIYVLDSPEQEDEVLYLAARLFPIYQIPMRVAILERNVGFAGANNAGASIARGRLLLLMNSDALPDRPGWLGEMARFYDSTPNIGALAPKLLYEDGSIQNAGMYFHQPPGETMWLDAHYFRGLHRDFPGANVARKVPLLCGACVMIARSLYEDLGGLRGIYVQGDYEDTDLCMRLMARGLENWYYPGAEVFHLEALSYMPSMRMPANRYNAWLHTHLWRKQIEELIADTETPGSGSNEAD
jgi:GT2 family glycosyltransferase